MYIADFGGFRFRFSGVPTAVARGVGPGATGALAALLLFAPMAHAVTLDAQNFLASCPGPIFVTEDTELTTKGSVTVVGDCLVSVEPGFSLDFNTAKIVVSGSFDVYGDASSLTLFRSAITAESIILDAFGDISLSRSRLTSTSGSIDLPGREGISFDRCTLNAADDIVIGGMGGTVSVVASHLTAAGYLRFQRGSSSNLGVPSEYTVVKSVLTADRIVFGGSNASRTIRDSKLIGLAASSDAVVIGGAATEDVDLRYVVDSRLIAPSGGIQFVGQGDTTIEDSLLLSNGEPVALGTGGDPHTHLLRSKLKARGAEINIHGSGTLVIEDCSLFTDGSDDDSGAITVGMPGGVSILGSTLKAKHGPIKIISDGDPEITDSKLFAGGLDTLSSGGDGIFNGITITGGLTRTVSGSSLKAVTGQVVIEGSGTNVVKGGSKLKAFGDSGMLFSGHNTTLTDSSFIAPGGRIRIPNRDEVILSGTKVAASGPSGVLIETGVTGFGVSDVSNSRIKGGSIGIHSYQTTSVTDNVLASKGTVEIDGVPCLSTGNAPNVPCL